MSTKILEKERTSPADPEVAFINNEQINEDLAQAKTAPKEEVQRIIAKGRAAKGLTPQETAILLEVTDPELKKELFAAALEVKEKIYGKRIVMFAPLYLSNYCINECTYCGYHRSNKEMPRRKLTMDEIAEEIKILEKMGHKRLALETGEDPVNCPIEYVLDAIKVIYETSEEQGEIRRVNVNIAATTVENYRKLRDAGIGTYILFQETYHRPTYKKLHLSGPKSSYHYHTTAFDRAMEGGIDDVGAGVLFGLYDYKFEVLALLYHALHLEEKFGVGPHTISVPRIRPASGMSLDQFPYLVQDEDFKTVIAILRLAVPYTGIILSTRETPEFRDEAIKLGVSQISAGSCTGVGSYKKEFAEENSCSADHKTDATAQFQVSDERTPEEVLINLCSQGYLPSYCTACYRTGRTGDRFMQLAKTGNICNVCLPNALTTFQEYLMDYASPQLKELGERTIENFVEEIQNDRIKELTIGNLEKIKEGQRDFFV
ncbi:iron-only hydrogenase maturation protein HydG [Syntrophobotulus glycolicus DSM 8271]|uniref:Iron-only hydrogenase maturation protein HydG n=1 Tax=Syntrophobotulus glycolicus (strain DSM 8271 / FlGlyR) TaxID=645991 RepID=F0SXS8_SYNGF|nr:[FeFe] hydrogenase H-cluster radical SAM maturase HydG [Syntrophobotulus glycolicus]ADY56989.1 iron-only hydrogenase maturation protein HydG [Syntrophobotulus glycolicus DSM 8271]